MDKIIKRRAPESAREAAGAFQTELRQFAAEAHISQRKIAETLGVSLRAVEEWVAGRREPQEYAQRLILDALRRTYTPDSLDIMAEEIVKVTRTEHDDGDVYAVLLRDGTWIHSVGMTDVLRRFIFDNRHAKNVSVDFTGQTVYER